MYSPQDFRALSYSIKRTKLIELLKHVGTSKSRNLAGYIQANSGYSEKEIEKIYTKLYAQVMQTHNSYKDSQHIYLEQMKQQEEESKIRDGKDVDELLGSI